MLKATPLIPWANISWSSKIGPKEGHLIKSSKKLKNKKNGRQWYLPYKCNSISIIIIFSDQYCHHTSAFQKKNSARRENHFIFSLFW